MGPFRFRARAALQLRQREHDEALATLARAQADLARARRRVEDADGAVRQADDLFREALKAPQAGMPLEWYRSWRVGLIAERHRRDAECRARETEMYQATANVTSTRKRVRALERLHDNALAAWNQAVQREEQKTMDALAALRFNQSRSGLRAGR